MTKSSGLFYHPAQPGEQFRRGQFLRGAILEMACEQHQRTFQVGFQQAIVAHPVRVVYQPRDAAEIAAGE